MADDADDSETIDDLPNDTTPLNPRPRWSPAPGLRGSPTPVYVPSKSTALEEGEPESTLPPAAVWVMKYRRHLHLTGARRSEEELRVVLGPNDDPVYVIDDGPTHTMVSREIGTDDSGAQYFLVGRIPIEAYEHCSLDHVGPEDIFTDAKDLAVCSAFAALEAVSNVAVAETYRRLRDVPAEYLPGQPLLSFTDDPSA